MFIRLSNPDRLVNADQVQLVSLAPGAVHLQIQGRQETVALTGAEAVAFYEKLAKSLGAVTAGSGVCSAAELLPVRLATTANPEVADLQRRLEALEGAVAASLRGRPAPKGR